MMQLSLSDVAQEAWSLGAFLFTHVYLTTLGHTPLAHTKAMVTGWEEEE